MTDLVPARWDFEVRVMTPDHQVLTHRVALAPDVVGGSAAIVDSVMERMAREVKGALQERDYIK